MRAIISSYAFIRLSVPVMDSPHLSLRRHRAFTLFIWLFSLLNCRQLKSCHVRAGKKKVMNMEHQLREVWRDCSLSSEATFLKITGKNSDHVTAITPITTTAHTPMLHSACTWLPKSWPRGFNNAKPSSTWSLNLCDLWQWGEAFLFL